MQYIVTVLFGILVGILITVPLGPTAIYVAQRTLAGDTKKGLLVASGAVIVDVFYCLVITMGLISLIRPYLENPIVQSIFSIFLIGYGIRMLVVRGRSRAGSGKDGNGEEGSSEDDLNEALYAAEVDAVHNGDNESISNLENEFPGPLKKLSLSRFKLSKSHYGDVLLGISMTLANPALFLSWVALLSFVTAHGLLVDSILHKLIFSASVGFGSMMWFLLLALFVRSRRHIISDTFIRRASSITALVIIGFGVYFTIVIFQRLNGAT